MARFTKRATASSAAEKPENRRPTSTERSAYFARREAAKVLRNVLQGDSKRRAVGSIKSLVYSPSVRNKKGTFALVCETLKCVDLHNHPLVLNGSVFMQGKASSMAAIALQPEPGWEVLDACAAPGNKTVHLAALMRGKGKIIACELHKGRVQRLKDAIKLSGAASILSVAI